MRKRMGPPSRVGVGWRRPLHRRRRLACESPEHELHQSDGAQADQGAIVRREVTSTSVLSVVDPPSLGVAEESGTGSEAVSDPWTLYHDTSIWGGTARWGKGQTVSHYNSVKYRPQQRVKPLTADGAA